MAKPIITDKPVIDQAEFNGVTIWRKEGGSIEVSDTNYPSMKAALQDIAAKAGIKLEEGWNTQYAGRYIIQQLRGGKDSQSAALQKGEPMKDKNEVKADGKMPELTQASIKEWDDKVQDDSKYGKEQSLIRDVIKRLPQNKDILDIAMKVSVIDLTNSTQLSNYKSKISLFDIANIILNIENFDKRVSSGDVSLVAEIARRCKDFGGKDKGVNLLSFASKYCCYHNVYQYNRDDYSIYDNVVSENLYLYSTKKLPLGKTTPEQWRKNIEYDKFNEYIGLLLDEYGIKIAGRRRMFDHFLWFANR